MSDPSIVVSGLPARFIDCTPKRSPEPSNTPGLIDINARIMEANGILVLARPIWSGDNSSVTTQAHERLPYGRVGGCIITGNEAGIKNCAQNLCTLQHIEYTISSQADAGGTPAYCNVRSGRAAVYRYDFDNPAYR